MAQLIHCPECRKYLQVPDASIGKNVKCPACSHAFVATLAPASTTKTPPPPSPSRVAPKPTVTTYCPDCGKYLQVADNIAGQKVQCPVCKSVFVANTAQAPKSKQPVPSHVSTAAPPPPQFRHQENRPQDIGWPREWYCILKGKHLGPVSWIQLQEWAVSGVLPLTETVWKRGPDGIATNVQMFNAQPADNTTTLLPPVPTTNLSSLPLPSPMAHEPREWYYLSNAQRCGPVSWAQLQQLVASGNLPPTELVWRLGPDGIAIDLQMINSQSAKPNAPSAHFPSPTPHPHDPRIQAMNDLWPTTQLSNISGSCPNCQYSITLSAEQEALAKQNPAQPFTCPACKAAFTVTICDPPSPSQSGGAVTAGDVALTVGKVAWGVVRFVGVVALGSLVVGAALSGIVSGRKTCNYCRREIDVGAARCPYCTSINP